MSETALPTIDSIIENFDASKVGHDEVGENAPMTFWLPLEYKELYEELQERSKRKFGKVLKEVLKRSIEKACLEPKAG